jgi:hypothetical protein
VSGCTDRLSPTLNILPFTPWVSELGVRDDSRPDAYPASVHSE